MAGPMLLASVMADLSVVTPFFISLCVWEVGLEDVCELVRVCMIAARPAVLVLDLYHEDRSAIRDEKWLKLCTNFGKIFICRVEERTIVGAMLHARYLGKPSRHTAPVALGADVRSRTKHSLHTGLLDFLKPCRYIILYTYDNMVLSPIDLAI
ncbi:hypothetical protein HBI50_114670 [Parastagonospora nodorum]|nr:hypothetical protein HBI50_114670 [Parastagonospora nodorum]